MNCSAFIPLLPYFHRECCPDGCFPQGAGMRSHTVLRNTQPKRRRLKSPLVGGVIRLRTVSERGANLCLWRLWKPRCLSALASRESLRQAQCRGNKARLAEELDIVSLDLSRAQCHHWKAWVGFWSALFILRIEGCPLRSFPMHHQGLLAKKLFFFFKI